MGKKRNRWSGRGVRKANREHTQTRAVMVGIHSRPDSLIVGFDGMYYRVRGADRMPEIDRYSVVVLKWAGGGWWRICQTK